MATPLPHARPWWHMSLFAQVIVAIIAGVLLAKISPAWAVEAKFFTDVFIKLLKCILGPIIFCTVVHGIAGSDKPAATGRIAGTAMIYFMIMTTFALVLGVIVGHVVQPGAGMNIDPATLDASALAGFTSASAKADFTFSGQILHLIPTTFSNALVQGEILQILFAAVLFGAALTQVSKQYSAPVLSFIGAVSQVFFAIIKMVMVLAPAAAFGAIGYTTGKYGTASLLPQLKLVGTFYATGLLFIVIVLGAVCRWAGFSIFALCRYLKEELLLVLGTSSSESALPNLIQKLEKLGCPRDTVGVVVPTGYSFNLAGTALAMTLSIMFMAQALNMHLSVAQQVQLLLLCMLTSKGAAGVVGSGMVVMVSTLQTASIIPVAAVALILGVDRFMSECRAVVNFLGNAVATLAIAKRAGTLDVVALRAELQSVQKPKPVSAASASSTPPADAWDDLPVATNAAPR